MQKIIANVQGEQPQTETAGDAKNADDDALNDENNINLVVVAPTAFSRPISLVFHHHERDQGAGDAKAATTTMKNMMYIITFFSTRIALSMVEFCSIHVLAANSGPRVCSSLPFYRRRLVGVRHITSSSCTESPRLYKSCAFSSDVTMNRVLNS